MVPMSRGRNGGWLLASSPFQQLENAGLGWGAEALPVCLLGAKHVAAHSSQAWRFLCVILFLNQDRECVALGPYSVCFTASKKMSKPYPVQKENLWDSGHWCTLFYYFLLF